MIDFYLCLKQFLCSTNFGKVGKYSSKVFFTKVKIILEIHMHNCINILRINFDKIEYLN